MKIIKLKPKYKAIFNLAKPYYEKGREADEEHHLVVATMMENLLQEYNLDEEIMMAAALLHDTGYAKIPPNKRKKHWAKKVRREHMKFGAELAKKVLKKVNYPSAKIKQVCAMIAIHDDPEALKTKESQILKEADILWMTTEKAFWLDVKRRPELGPSDWLKVLEYRFKKDKRYKQFLKTKFSQKQVQRFLKKMKQKTEKIWRKYV